MEKYNLINWETVPFNNKRFDWQLDRYAKVCVTRSDNPQKVLLIIPFFGTNTGSGFANLIHFVHNCELGQDNLANSILVKPVDGDIIDVSSMHGPLFRVYTKDEARYGICRKEDVGKVERTPTGKVKIYHSIKVFTIYIKDNETGNIEPLSGWEPEQMYRRFFGYNYRILSDLTEPLQL